MVQARRKLFQTSSRVWAMIRHNPKEVCLAVFLAVQVSFFVFSNLTMIDKNLDCDNAMLLKHIITMWEEKTLSIPGWSYVSTLEWDCTTLLALPLYGLTGNIYLACALSNAALMCLLLAGIFFVFQGESRMYPLLCANLICIPYRIGKVDYFNMLFFAGAQYIIKVMIPLLLIGILLSVEQKKPRKKGIGHFGWSVIYFCCGLAVCPAVYM